MIARRVANVHSLMRRRFWDSIPLPDLFDYSSRSGLNLVDALGGSNAAILGGKVALLGGSNKIRIPTFTKSLNEVFEISGYTKPLSATTYTAIYSQMITSTSRFVALVGSMTYLFTATSLNTQNAGTGTSIPLFSLNQFNFWKLKSLGNGNIEITINTTTVTRVYNVTDRIIIDDFGFAGAIGSSGVAHNAYNYNLNNEFVYHFNNLYNSITGVPATNSGATFPLITTSTPASTTDALADGYFQLSGGEQVVKPQFTLPVGDINHVGGQVHNLISSFVTFPAGSSMDRSNTTIFNATCRASIYYDSSNPRRWHVSELNYETMNSFLQESYRNTRFVSFKTNYSNQLYIDRMMGFTAPLTGSKLTYIQKLIRYIS